jgi:hypothetical protein
MCTKSVFLLSIWIALLAVTCGLSQEHEMKGIEVLEHYKASISYLESVSMKIAIHVDSNDSHLFPQTLDFVFRSDMQTDRAEWLGKQMIYKEDGEIDVTESMSIKDIADGNMYISMEGDRFASEIPGSRVILFNDYKKRLKDLMENPNYGGALFGRMYGSNYKSVADLLTDSPNLIIHSSREILDGVTCVVLEGTSKYGKATAWIAPDKGYNALKWTIEKTPQHLFNNAPIKSKHWQVTYGVREFHEININSKTTYVPKRAHCVHSIDVRKGPKNIDHYEYETSDIQLEPDFESLGAFKIDLPNGIRVYNRDFDAVPFVWQDGKPIPYVKRELLDVLEIEINQVKDEIEPKRIASVEAEKDVPLDEPTVNENMQTDTLQAQKDVPMNGSSGSSKVLILIVLSIVSAVVCGVFLLRRRQL